MFKNLLKPILDIIFPSMCINCKKEGALLCDDCFKTIEICNILKTAEPIQKIYIPCLYHKNPILQKAIHRLKYTFYKDLANPLSQLLKQMIDKYPLPNNIHIVPIPLHKKRQKFRGFNQSEILAQQLNLPISNLLIRTKHTERQATLNKHQRKLNLENSFVINPKIQFRKTTPLLILDDICTTFSTMREAAKALQKAGFKIIFGIVIAHAELK